MIVYLIWFSLGLLGAAAIGIGARSMLHRWREADVARGIALFFGVLVLQHLVFVYLAGRLILDIPGPSGILLLTIAQGLVTPVACWLALRLR